jgi:hypothetical protein
MGVEVAAVVAAGLVNERQVHSDRKCRIRCRNLKDNAQGRRGPLQTSSNSEGILFNMRTYE